MTLNGHHQDWKSMAVLWLLLTIPLTYFASKYTWSIGTDWQTFYEHQTQWFNILKESFFKQTHSLNEYQSYLVTNDFLDDFWFHLSISLILSSLISAYVSFKLIYVDGGFTNYKYKSGIKLLVNKIAVKHHKKHSPSTNLTPSLPLHPQIPFYFEELSGNLLALGSQGSGKSTSLKPILNRLFDLDSYSIIYDAKLEYVECFYSDSTILINPFDVRSYRWDIAKDIKNELDAQKVAEAFIQHTGSDQFWVDGARQIFVGILLSLQGHEAWGWKDLSEQLNISTTKLKQALNKYYPIAEKLIEEDSKTTQSFLTVLNTQLSWLPSVAKYWDSEKTEFFSVKEWVLTDTVNRQIIIPNLPRYSHISASLCGSIISLITSEVLTQPDNNKQFWLFVDELADLPKTDALLEWLSKGRSKGARTICATQSISQLYSKYGDKDAETLISLFANKILFRTNSFDASERLSKSIGKQTVEYTSKAINSNQDTTITTNEKEIRAVPPELIMQLPTPDKNGVSGILTKAGYGAAYYLKWPYPQLNQIAEGFITKGIEQPDISQTNRRGIRGRNRSC